MSSIEHGGTRTFFNMVDQYFGNDSLEPFESKFISSTGLAIAYLWLRWTSLMRGYETIFQYVGIFIKTIVWNFCEVLLVAGDFILFSLHMTMVWDLANGAGILAPSDAIDVCVSKHQSALIGGDGDSNSTAGPKARGLRPPSR